MSTSARPVHVETRLDPPTAGAIVTAVLGWAVPLS